MNLVQISRTHVHVGEITHDSNPSIPMWRWEVKTGDFSGAHGPDGLLYEVTNQCLCFKLGGRHVSVLWSVHLYYSLHYMTRDLKTAVCLSSYDILHSYYQCKSNLCICFKVSDINSDPVF